MTNEDFAIEVDKSVSRSKSILIKKEVEYSRDNDRLRQFHHAGSAQGISAPSLNGNSNEARYISR